VRLLLAGGGHAHAVVLRAFARRRPRGIAITLVSPSERHTYSGMVPGLIAGHYRIEDVQLDLRRLAAAAGAQFVRSSITRIFPEKRKAALSDGSALDYDVASLNIGSHADTSVPGSAEHGLPAKPFEPFIARVQPLLRADASIAIAGGGVAGLELAMALRHRAQCRVTVYSAKSGLKPALARRLAAAVHRLGVELRTDAPVEAVHSRAEVDAAGKRQKHDLVVLATGAAPAAWLKASGLGIDARGFVQVDHALRSVSHPGVFAAGDCTAIEGERVPKSGVYAVRQGEVLARNLLRAMKKETLERYEPQSRALALISCGERYAVAEWGEWTAEGAWAWRWKDWIDRRWMASFRSL
jgi:selenide,water dikinase